MSRLFLFGALFAVLLAVAALPAAADPAAAASASAYGVEVTPIGLEPTPLVEAAIPPGPRAEESETVLDVPADPVVSSATITATAVAATASEIEATLQEVIEGVSAGTPAAWNARGDALTEGLTALQDTLTADVLEAEALAACIGGQAVFATGSRIEQLTLAGSDVDVIEQIIGPGGLALVTNAPNDVVFESAELGLRITAWETNWDGATGIVGGGDTVFVNSLHVEVLAEGVLGQLLGAQDVVVSHAEATMPANCAGAAGALPGDGPLADISKTASSQTVTPGSTFTYTIVVPNSDPTCTLETVRVVDTITGPAGSTITSTDPTADSINGLTVTWNDIGPIAPGVSETLTIGVSVPTDAPDGSEYSENLAVTANCAGQPVNGGLDFVGPTVAAGPAVTPPPPAPGPTLPRTGPPFGELAALGLLGAGMAAWRLRRFAA